MKGEVIINTILVPVDLEKTQKFICPCGNVRKIKGRNLLRSKSNACNCTSYLPFTVETAGVVNSTLRNRYHRLWGKAYTMVERYKAVHNRCGCIVTIKGDDMPTCKHCHTGSRGEVKVGKILDGYGIPYEKEFSFPDLRTSAPLRFDFAVLGKCLIEYQGEQHYFYVPRVSGTKKKFEAGLMRDQMKRDYCGSRGIPLLEIKYDWSDYQIHQAIRGILN